MRAIPKQNEKETEPEGSVSFGFSGVVLPAFPFLRSAIFEQDEDHILVLLNECFVQISDDVV